MTSKSSPRATQARDGQRIAGEIISCDRCAKAYYVEADLWRHIEAKHIGQPLGQAPSGRKAQDKISPSVVPASPTQVSGKINPGQSHPTARKPSQGSPDPCTLSSAPEAKVISGKGLYDLSKLSLNPDGQDESSIPRIYDSHVGINPLKRTAEGELGSSRKFSGAYFPDQHLSRTRRPKIGSGGSHPHVGSLNNSNERAATHFNAGPGDHFRVHDRLPQTRRVHDPRTHVFRPKHVTSSGRENLPLSGHVEIPHPDQGPDQPRNADIGPTEDQPTPELVQDVKFSGDKSAMAITPEDEPGPDQDQESEPETTPTMIRQPQTRDISHEQLLAEVKGIYAGLVMVESKCIDVDEKQQAAALDKSTAKRTRPTDEQWRAQITLHKTLLHEHHDFFLASQHPSASPTLTKMAATYQMPARMWRHAIHAFLEVLRHRLPESLEHMLAFISIAFAMMTLLVETVPMFENTWIECLGDLGRYRMAIEDNDMRDRETFAGVSRYWYGKASYQSPNIGRLYHHLAILSRPFSLQQLSNYARSLTCITPFESARGSVMTLFNPVLSGKDSASLRVASFETRIIKAHALQVCNFPRDEFWTIVQEVRNGALKDHVNKVTSKFKEQGVFLAIACIAAILEYGALRKDGSPKALLWITFRDAIALVEKLHDRDQGLPVPSSGKTGTVSKIMPRSGPAIAELTTQELDNSSHIVFEAASLMFACVSTALQSPRNNNFHPFLHVVFVFLWSLASTEEGMSYVEGHVPWEDVCFFLNTLSKAKAVAVEVFQDNFPQPAEGMGRPLPEDYPMRGQMFTWWYFPQRWFLDCNVDDEERVLELPSMSEPRLERIRWLGGSIATRKLWIQINPETQTFETTEYAKKLESQKPLIAPRVKSPAKEINNNQEMTDTPFESPTKSPITGSPLAPPTSTNTKLTPNIPMDNIKDSNTKTKTAPTKIEYPTTVSWLQGNVLDQEKGPPIKKPLEKLETTTGKTEMSS